MTRAMGSGGRERPAGGESLGRGTGPSLRSRGERIQGVVLRGLSKLRIAPFRLLGEGGAALHPSYGWWGKRFSERNDEWFTFLGGPGALGARPAGLRARYGVGAPPPWPAVPAVPAGNKYRDPAADRAESIVESDLEDATRGASQAARHERLAVLVGWGDSDGNSLTKPGGLASGRRTR